MKAIVINGSPRKKWNTDKALQRAAQGFADAGGTVETVRLYDYEYKGCVSCFACKIKNSKTNGLCAYRDALRPVLEKVREADAVIVGTPVYYSFPTGQTRSFLERWLFFPVGTYVYKDGKQVVVRDKVVPTGLIYTMNVPRELMANYNYDVILSDSAKSMEAIMGYNELLYICNTYQFNDYSRYDMTLFNEEDKRQDRDAHFEEDLEKAYQLGLSIGKKTRQIEEEQNAAN